MDVGGDLRRTREARKLSLADIAERTKINQSLLRAIEQNRFDLVPGGLFTRGYLRAYAREVQLDPEEIVERYRAAFEIPPAEPDPSTEESSASDDIYSMAAADDGRGSGSHVIGLIVVLLIGAAYFSFARTNSPQAASDNTPQPTPMVGSTAHEPAPAPTTGTLPTTSSVPLKLVVQTTADCWVAAVVDGKQVIARLMRSGEREQFEVGEKVTMRVGNPLAFSFTLNGMPGRVLGTAHTAVNLTFDRHNYKSVVIEKPL